MKVPPSSKYQQEKNITFPFLPQRIACLWVALLHKAHGRNQLSRIWTSYWTYCLPRFACLWWAKPVILFFQFISVKMYCRACQCTLWNKTICCAGNWDLAFQFAPLLLSQNNKTGFDSWMLKSLFIVSEVFLESISIQFWVTPRTRLIIKQIITKWMAIKWVDWDLDFFFMKCIIKKE